MKSLPLSPPSLKAWRKREYLTGAEAAYLLAGWEPVKNPSPSLPANVKVPYSHLMNAIYSGQLPAKEIYRRIEPDAAWLDSLPPEEYIKQGCEWEEISKTHLKQDDGHYRFKIDASSFFAWADSDDWFTEFLANASDEVSKSEAGMLNQDGSPMKQVSAQKASPLNGFYALALRLAMASGAPKKREKFIELMEQYGIKPIGKNTLDPALKIAKDESIELNFKTTFSGQEPDAVIRLFKCAYLHNALEKGWMPADLKAAKEKWQEAEDADELEGLLGKFLIKHRIKPSLTHEHWRLLVSAKQ